jgi:hypothetical protein
LLVKPTTTPPAGAGEASVTVPVAACPLVTEEGATERLARVAVGPVWVLVEVGITLTVAEVEFAEEAVIVAVAGDVTKAAVTGKVAVVSPGGTATDAGTVTAGLLLDRSTDAPPDPTGDNSVTVPVPT